MSSLALNQQALVRATAERVISGGDISQMDVGFLARMAVKLLDENILLEHQLRELGTGTRKIRINKDGSNGTN